MTRVCAVALTVVLLSAGGVFAEAEHPEWNSKSIYPADVMNTKYLSAVEALMSVKAITGDTDGLFHPERTINRAEFATIVAKATRQQNMGASTAAKFSDLGGYGWATAYIDRCHENGWITGIGGDMFAPGREITYAEVITVLIRVRREQQGGLVGKWPDVYIQYAETYNMRGNADITDWNAPARRGDVAIMVNHVIAPEPDNTGIEFEARPE